MSIPRKRGRKCDTERLVIKIAVLAHAFGQKNLELAGNAKHIEAEICVFDKMIRGLKAMHWSLARLHEMSKERTGELETQLIKVANLARDLGRKREKLLSELTATESDIKTIGEALRQLKASHDYAVQRFEAKHRCVR